MSKCKLPKIEVKIHKRILNFLNAANRPEDLQTPPHLIRRDITGAKLDDSDNSKKDKQFEPLFDTKTARCVFDWREENRPVGGFAQILDLIDIVDNDILPGIIDGLIYYFGPKFYGAWNTLYQTPVPVAHAALVHTNDDEHAGRVLFIERVHYSPTSQTPVWDPESADSATAFETPVPPTDNLYCCGHSFLTDGKLLTVGGGGENNEVPNPNMAWLFDPADKQWHYTTNKKPGSPDFGNRTTMIHGRWYPTSLPLGDDSGRVLVANGEVSEMEVYNERTGIFNAIEHNIVDGVDVSLRSFPGLYPGLHLLPDGEVFDPRTGFASATSSAASFSFSSSVSGKWTELADGGVGKDRTKGMSVLMLRQKPSEPDRVLVAGGNNSESRTNVGIIDAPPSGSNWRTIDFPDSKNRTNVNVVLLPDGKAFICGGTITLPHTCLAYDPENVGDPWDTLDALDYERNYHSLALLLPSAKVMITGGDSWGPDDDIIEVFSPPYLFNLDGSLASRPEITSFPNPDHGHDISHGQSFEIKTAHPEHIRKIVLMRPMAVTHQTDTEQRVLSLCFEPSESDHHALQVTVPDGRVYPYDSDRAHTHAVAPRGYYLLFIIDNKGVPSPGKFVRLR